MQGIYRGCQCNNCPYDLDSAIFDVEKGSFKKAPANQNLFGAKRKQRNEDAYEQFIRNVNKTHPDAPNPIQQTLQHFKIITHNASMGEQIVNEMSANPISVKYQNQLTDDEDFPTFSREEKRQLFEKSMAPWKKVKSKKLTDSSQNIEKKKIVKPSPIELKQEKIEKIRHKFKTVNVTRKDVDEFLATATAASLQKYYRTVPARTDSKPVKFAVNISQMPRLEVEANRLREIQRDNLKLLLKIVTIQQTTGRIDNKNLCKPAPRKTKEINSKIEKIKAENLKLRKTLQEKKGKLPTRLELKEDWKRIIDAIRENAQYPLSIPGLIEVENLSADDEYRPRVFIEFGIQNGNVLGRIILSLFLDLMPHTVTNFVALCENFQLHKDSKKNNQKAVHYMEAKREIDDNSTSPEVEPYLAGSLIHRIFPKLYFEGGDILKGNGSTGKAAMGSDFYPDRMNVPHNYAGTISMTITPEGRINSLFAISFRPLEILKGRRPAFGRVVKGLKLLEIIESYGTKNGKPKQKILVTRCGLIQPR